MTAKFPNRVSELRAHYLSPLVGFISKKEETQRIFQVLK